MSYENKILTPTLFISLIILMGIITYLNQEVPACVNSPTPKEINITTNFSSQIVNEINEQVQTDVVVFQTSGDSMSPVIEDQQKCVCYNSQEYSIGDIVVFFVDLGDGFTGVAHEIISIDGENITTKGVNNPEADYPIKQENILCKIPLIKRWGLIGL